MECPPKTGDFEDIYLVSDKITPVRAGEINTLERRIGSLPRGYRQFMRRCGGDGRLFDEILVYPPRVILDEVSRYRDFMTSRRLEDVRERRGLVELDFDDLWVFGSDAVRTAARWNGDRQV